ncbi:MAG: MFS transporter, partial [Candidatus Poribacteria bacterium]
APHIGPSRMPYASFIGIIATILLYKFVSLKKIHDSEKKSESIFQIIKPKIRLIFFLFMIVTLRSTTTIVFVNFLSLLIKQRQLSLMIGAIVLFIFSLSTAVGTFLGGYICKWVSRRSLLMYSMSLSSPLLIWMLYSNGTLFVILLILSGIVSSCSNPVNLAIAQEAIPKGASTASSLMMGASWGVAAIIAMFFGMIADRFGGNVVPAMAISAVLPIVASFFAIPLPKR